MPEIPLASYVLSALALLLIITYSIPATRKAIYSFLDRIGTAGRTRTYKIPSVLSFNSKKSKVSDVAQTKSEVQTLIDLLNEKRPSDVAEIKATIVQVYGTKVFPTVRPDEDDPDRFPWRIQFYPLKSRSSIVKIVQTKDGKWKEKEKHW